ncbi:hypothetical protein [Pedobacter nutrimenti]|uniref:Uncharacterized protein n=1 Tax=Pedobacter nutrimenti TaxID=1241337 RepID=A0A318US33_9SPHI|nr:hypothetical protein [Pedobacter nutrimenti]PYF74379.1 hypothetical protein B0O44_104550 [Pedobacter nutrimenti]
MKKAFFTFMLFTITGVLSFAQTRPTKQEIVNWIIEKVRLYSEYKLIESNNTKVATFFSIDANQNIEQHITGKGFTMIGTEKLEDICSAELDELNRIKIQFKQPIVITQLETGGKVTSGIAILYLNESKENNLRNRMIKALNDLGSYNCPKAKEVY